MNYEDIDYRNVAVHIPAVMQELYNEKLLNSTSLEEMRDAFRPNQMQSKAWLLSQLEDADRESKILVIGGWFGFTTYCLCKMGFSKVVDLDPDERLDMLTMSLNRNHHNVSRSWEDINNYNTSEFDIIINSSCEHIADDSWFEKIAPGTRVILQSTNIKIKDHVNTVNSLEEMKNKYKLNYTYADEMKFNDMFTRFMLCGIKE